MRIIGLAALQKSVPEFAGPAGLSMVALRIGVVLLLTSLFFIAADRYFPDWMPDGEVVILALGFLLLSRFFSQRQRYQSLYGEKAFYLAFTRFSTMGLGMVGAAIAHLAYISGPDIPPVWWRLWLQAMGWIVLVGGLVLWLRSVTALGIDTLLMLYVYRPANAERTEAGVYAFIRHPLYSAALHIGAGLALIHANWYALLVAVLLPVFFYGWVRLVQERDLLLRFPEYAEYRRRVPAFAPRPGRWLGLWRLLVTGRP